MSYFDQVPEPKGAKGWPWWMVLVVAVIGVCLSYLAMSFAELADDSQPQTTEVSAK